MSAIGRRDDDRSRDQAAARLSLPGAQAGVVHAVDGSQVTIRLGAWGDRQYFGPVTWCAAQGNGPAAGDTCVLLSDAAGQVLIAIVVGSGDPV